ncbi:MAG: hypothetical protein Q9225_004868 [Loekoesia sp. 1 TL-2023]
MVKFPLLGLTIAATGDFGSKRSHANLKQCIERNGGQWATKIAPGVTHLVCTKEDYRSKAPMVKQALRLKLFTIVTYDWLEGKSHPNLLCTKGNTDVVIPDSLMKGYRLAPKGDYLVARAIKDAKKIKKEKKRMKKETIKKGVDDFKKECQDIQKQLFSDRYHIYRDSTYFAYDITLVRVNLLQNKSERYVLRLCTTHDVPKYYASLLTYHTHGSPAHKSILAPIGSDFATAFGAFVKAFKAKTKVEWDERLKTRKWEEGAFVYTPPKGGEPKGEVPGDFEIKG